MDNETVPTSAIEVPAVPSTAGASAVNEMVVERSDAPRPSPFPVVRELALLSGVLVSVFLFPYAYMQARTESLVRARGVAPASASISAPAANAASTTIDTKIFHSLALLGASAAVFDVATGEFLYANNADASLPIASVTKLMTALVVYELMPSLDATVRIPDTYTMQEYSALHAGDTFSVRDLLDYTLIVSSNEGATVLADAAAKSALGQTATADDFVRAMNMRAESLGLTETHFRNPSGLDIDPATPGAVSSAHDIARLLAFITSNYPDLLTATTQPRQRFVSGGGFVYDAVNTNGVVRAIPGLIASKTGFETTAGGTLAIAFDAGLGRTITIVVLGSTRNGRFNDVLQLVEATRGAL